MKGTKRDNGKMDDDNGNCKNCGHPFDPHIVIAFDITDLGKGGILKGPIENCACQYTLDFDLKKN